MNRLKYRKIIRGLANMGVSHSTMHRMFGVSITIITYIVNRNEYKPTPRIQAIIVKHLDDFLFLLQK